MLLHFLFFYMHIWVDAKHGGTCTKIEHVTCETVFARKLTAKSETNLFCRKKFLNFFYAPGAGCCCTSSFFICISGPLQNTEDKIALMHSCGACLQEALQGHIGQGEIGNRSTKFGFLNKKLF